MFDDQETSFLHPSSATTLKFQLPFLTIDKGTSSNSSIDSSDFSSVSLGSASTDEPSCDSNLDPSIHTSSNSSSASSIVLHCTMVLASSSLSLPVPGISWCIYLAPVLYSSFTLSVQMATIVVQLDDDNFNIDIKGKEYQQLWFLFELTTIHRK